MSNASLIANTRFIRFALSQTHAFSVGPATLKEHLANRKAEGPHSMIDFPQFAAGDPVLVLFQRDSSYNEGDDILFVPQGTRLVGIWSAEQPAEPPIYAVVVAGTTWHFEVPNAVPSSLKVEQCQTHQEQGRIAHESFERAQEYEREGHSEEAQRFYARAIVELEANGESAEGQIADARFKRALLLREIGMIAESIIELEQLARAFQSAAVVPGYGTTDRNYAELAAQALNTLGRTILHYADTDTKQQKLRQTADRMLRALQPIARRYETKVEVWLTTAEIFFTLGDTDRAQSLFHQADELYQRQLISTTRSNAVTLHLDRVRDELGLPKRKQRTSRKSNSTKQRKKP